MKNKLPKITQFLFTRAFIWLLQTSLVWQTLISTTWQEQEYKGNEKALPTGMTFFILKTFSISEHTLQ